MHLDQPVRPPGPEQAYQWNSLFLRSLVLDRSWWAILPQSSGTFRRSTNWFQKQHHQARLRLCRHEWALSERCKMIIAGVRSTGLTYMTGCRECFINRNADWSQFCVIHSKNRQNLMPVHLVFSANLVNSSKCNDESTTAMFMGTPISSAFFSHAAVAFRAPSSDRFS